MSPNRRVFLKQLAWSVAGLSFVPFVPACHTPRIPVAFGQLPRSTPEAEGVSSAALLAFLDALSSSQHEFHSFMLMRHGRVVAEGWWTPYGPEFNHTLYSLSKSFTSTAVGLAVADGRLSVQDRVVKFFPNDLPKQVSDNLANLRVKDLLTMSVGDEKEPTLTMVKEENWVRTFLEQPITHAPGTTFMYNSGASYMLSAIVQKVTGQKVIDYLTPRLFDPLAIEGATWEVCPRGINTGGWGLSVPTEALAKFGQLYLQKGVWAGRRLLSAEWIEEATTFKIQQPTPANPTRPNDRNDWLQGYCYQFWRCTHNAYRGDGAFGQFAIVLPEHEAVLAITSESPSMQGELDLVWEHLLPGIQAKPLPKDREAYERLQARLAHLQLPLAQGVPSSPTASRISGKTFRIEPNDLGFQTVAFGFSNDAGLVSFRTADAEYVLGFRFQRWDHYETALPGTPPRLGGAPKPGTKAKVAASAAWKDEATLELLLRFYETPHHDTVTCRFDGNKVEISFRNSIIQLSPGQKDKRPILRGEMMT